MASMPGHLFFPLPTPPHLAPVSSLSLVFLLLISDPFAVFFVFLDTLDEIFIQAQSPNNGGFVRLTLERLLFSQALPLNPGEEALRLSGSLSP